MELESAHSERSRFVTCEESDDNNTGYVFFIGSPILEKCITEDSSKYLIPMLLRSSDKSRCLGIDVVDILTTNE